MIKRNGMIALGSILAVAGCSSGGHSSSNPAVPAAKVNHPLATGHLTINPSVLKHAAKSRRRPSFVDGLGNGGALTLEISSQTNDGSLSTQVTIVPLSAVPGPVSVSVPLYGPSGFVRVQEFVTDSANLGGKQLLADNGGNEYFVTPGQDDSTQLTVTLQAILGGVVLSDTADGSSSFPNTQFVPLGNPSALTYTAPSGAAFLLYAFPADAAGNFTNLSVPGGFPNAVTVSGNGGGNLFAQTTSLPGVFNVCTAASAGGVFSPETDFFSFIAADGFSQFQQSTLVGITGGGGGYLGTCGPNTPSLTWTTQSSDPRFSSSGAPIEGGGPFFQFLSPTDAPASLVLVDTGPPFTPSYVISSSCPAYAISGKFPLVGVSVTPAQPLVLSLAGAPLSSFCQITATDNRTPAQTASLTIFINSLTGTIH